MNTPVPVMDIDTLLAALRAQMAADFEQQKKDIVAQLRAENVIPQVVVPIDVGRQFAESDPGIGQPAGDLHEIVAGAVEGTIPVVQEELNAFVFKAVHFLHAKLDALVQATGHGNSVAMAKHL